jgi:site-specific DNA-methyltransferase (adenine-specific)
MSSSRGSESEEPLRSPSPETPDALLSLPRLEAAEDLLRGGALVLGDGLDVARMLPAGSIDLVYLDPPFGTGAAKRPLKGRADRFKLGTTVAFPDPGGPGLSHWLADLLVETRRVLRPGGALFLHLDWRLVHHARGWLDRLYGEEHFLNEIVWHYATGGVPTRWFARKHDTILYYRNGPGHTFHRRSEVKRLKHRVARPGVTEFQDEDGWFRYRFLDDVWEIPWLTQDSRERTGYPSQKPVALLLRIIEAATDPGMRVADFCGGSGTTAVAARRLGRQWISSDLSVLAMRVARARLNAEVAVPPATPGADSADPVRASRVVAGSAGYLVADARHEE